MEDRINKISLIYWFFMTILSLMLYPDTSTWAENIPMDHQPYTLGEVVVTADKPDAEGPVTIAKVTAKDIEQQNATNLGEALKLVPGVYFRQGRSKEGYYITMRGFEQENVLILLDGIPLGVPYEGLVNLTDIPVQNIAEIKVIKGNASVLYGPNAMGGVINIITKKGTTDPQLSVSYQQSDYDTHHLSLTHGWSLGPFSYFLGASRRESDGYRLSDTFTLPAEVLASMAVSPANPTSLPNVPIAPDSGKRENSYYDKDAFTFTGNLGMGSRHDLGISFEYYNNDYGVPPVPIFREHKKGFFYFPRYWQFSDWERYTLNITEEARLSEMFRIKTRIFYDNYDNTLKTYDDATYSTQNRIGPPSGNSIYDDYSLGAQIQTFWDGLSGNHISFGFQFKKDIHRENFNESPFDKFESYTYSVALEDRIDLSDKLALTIGASYDVFDKKTLDMAGEGKLNPGEDVGAFSPQIGLSYDLSDTLNIYGSAGRKVRFPTMRNLYSEGIIGPQGNPNLKEERSDNYEVGTIWKPSQKVRTQLALFYSDIQNMINFDNIIGRFEQYKNADIAGVDASIFSQLTRSLSAQLSYTFLYARNDSSVIIENEYYPSLVYTPDELPYRPEHSVHLDITQQFDFGCRINLNGGYTSRQPYYGHVDLANNKLMTANQKWLDEYWLFNGKISQTIKQKYEIFAAVENMFDEAYEDIAMIPGRGRTFWIGAKLSL
jgi:outer membrane receptor protein involved in Fe transport